MADGEDGAAASFLAQGIANRRLQLLSTNGAPFMVNTVSELVSLFLSSTADQVSEGTLGNYRRLLDRFAVHCSAVPLNQLKPIHLMEWGKTWHEIQAVQRLFSWAKDDAEVVERNPFRRVKRPPLGERHRVMTPAETARILRAARHDFRAYMIALRETMARPQEIRAVRWCDLQAASGEGSLDDKLATGQGFFVLREYKSRKRCANPNKPRIILISPRLGRMLVRLRWAQPAELEACFKTWRDVAWSKEAARQRFRGLRRRLGLGEDEAGESLVCYSFRHTAATRACAKGLRDRILADVLGHTKTTTTARYQHLQVEHLQAAMRAVWS